MRPFDVKKFAEQLKFGKGTIITRDDAVEYIKIGYSPNRLIKQFKIIDTKALQYILAQIAINKTKLN